MPKLKTKKAAKKRFSYTAGGSLKRTTANRRHRLATKTKRQKKNFNSPKYVRKTDAAGVANMLPYGN